MSMWIKRKAFWQLTLLNCFFLFSRSMCEGCQASVTPRGMSRFERVITSTPYLSEKKMTGKIIRNVSNKD